VGSAPCDIVGHAARVPSSAPEFPATDPPRVRAFVCRPLPQSPIPHPCPLRVPQKAKEREAYPALLRLETLLNRCIRVADREAVCVI
jgi:hypothetical protein